MRIVCVVFVVGVLAGCSSNKANPPIAKPESEAPPVSAQPVAPKKDAETDLLPAGPNAKTYPHLHNLLRVNDRIYSGGEPHEDDAFAELSKLGVKTVVSVDGAKPDVEKAKKHGIRYIHIPIGYDGVSKEAGESLARVVREFDGPIYVHCHHGKHRGPAAAAVACVASGTTKGKEAITILQCAGTSKDYAGLWRDVENYQPPAADAKLPELVEVAKVDSFAAAMAQVDRAYDNLKLSQEAKWTTPANHPDIVPDQEALLLQEGLHEAGRQSPGGANEELKKWLAEAEQKTKDLQASLKGKDLEAATKTFKDLDQSCKQCHKKYRDPGTLHQPK